MLALCMHFCYTKPMTKPVYNVRIDPEIYKKVSIMAHLERRTITSEVNQLLKESLMRPSTQQFVAHNLRATQAQVMNQIKEQNPLP